MTDTLIKSDPLVLAIARLEDPQTSIDEIAETLNQLDFAMERAKEMKKAGEAALSVRLNATGKSVQIGQWLYSMKHPKTTSCISNRQAAEACFNAVAGDFDQFCALLSSDAFKHGACAKILPPEIYEGIFITIYPDKLEKKLVKADMNFLPKRKGATDTNQHVIEQSL